MNRPKCPLKLILFGEHAVLNGGRCIAVAINMYASMVDVKRSYFVRLEDKKYDYFHVSIKDHKLKLVADIREECSVISVDTYFGCGLGTSASISLLLSFFKNRSFLRFELVKDTVVQAKSILEQAQDFEHVFHYKSSGVDVCTAYYGGLISFKEKTVEEMDYSYLKQFKILIYDSKISKQTGKVVKSEMNNKKNNISKLILLSEKVYNLLKGDFELRSLYKYIREAEDIYEDMGLVPDLMKDEVRRLRNLGIEAKISGAGRGGHLFTIVDKEMFLEGWQEVKIDQKGFKPFCD
ncbi:putative mevalonate kinase [Nosema granulosis]|uniref:Mevalonate kinase n=1 Tax=Nosema granulosis TaxID=83296 RepID=A0A9P6H0V9_9MICR|nr:putative mevalonate kinase [Nosema granulosis]